MVDLKEYELKNLRFNLLDTPSGVLLTEANKYSLQAYKETITYAQDGYLGDGVYINQHSYLEQGIESALRDLHRHQIEYIHKEFGVKDEDGDCYCDEVYDIITEVAELLFKKTHTFPDV